MAKFSKDGKTFYEIPDDEDNLRKASEKGYTPYMDVSKEGGEVFTIPAHASEYQKAQAKGYRAVVAQQATDDLNNADYAKHPVAAGLMGAANTMSMGLNDEIGGVAHAVANPLHPIDSYVEGRDSIRKDKDGLAKANPKSNMTGSIAGGFVGPGMVTGGMGLIKGMAVGAGTGAAQGTVSRFGNAEGEITDQLKQSVDPKGLAIDAGIGAVTGGLAGGARNIKDTGRVVGEVAESVKPAAHTVGEITNAYHTGRADKGSISGPLAGATAAVKKVLAIRGDEQTQAKIADAFRKHLGPGHSKDMTNPEIIIQMVEEGNEQAINYVVNRAGSISGNVSDDFANLLKAGSNKRTEARSFNFDKAGEELAGDMDNLSSTLQSSTKTRRGELEEVARNSYQGDTQSILDNVEKQFFSAGELNSTKGAQSVLSDVHSIIGGGKNAEDLGLQAGNWKDFDGAEQFNRLQKARQHLDNEIDWEAIKRKTKSPTSVDLKLIQVRKQIDEALKGASEAKVDSDSMVKDLMGIQDNLLNNAKHKGEFDKYKMGGLLTDNVSAKRFRDNLDMLNNFSNKPGISPEVKQAVDAFRDKFAKHLDTAELRRTIQRFENATVGSAKTGRSVQSAAALARGDNVLQELTRVPEQGIRTAEDAVGKAEKYFGVPFNQMTQEQKSQLIRFRMALKKNPDLDFIETAHKWNESK